MPSRLLSTGGSLVYATCTYMPRRENEEVVDWLLRKTRRVFFKLTTRSHRGDQNLPMFDPMAETDL